jgi:hypothetical protein
MKRMKYPTPALADLWKKNFMRDTMKFAKSTHLLPEDYMAEFEDSTGEKWRVLGCIEAKEMPCEKISSGEVFIWDRWKVSLLVRPAEHKKAERRVEMVFPEKKKKSRKKAEETPEVASSPQLSLFDQPEEEKVAQVLFTSENDEELQRELEGENDIELDDETRREL